MKRFLYASAFMLLIGGAALLEDRAVGQTAAPAPAGAPVPAPAAAAKAANPLLGDPHGAMINTYCVGCHNTRLKIGGVVLEGLDIKHPAANAETWERALNRLRGRLMPPPGSPQPKQEDIDSFSSWMADAIDATPSSHTAGHVPLQRLSRSEYVASVKDLLGIDVNEKDVLPQDVQVEGFDNIASALTTSPAFLDQYIDAARRIARRSVGDLAPPISVETFQTDGNQDPALPFPPGMRGGIKFEHSFPADAEYRFSFFDLDIGLYNRQMQNTTTLVLMLDGKIVFKGPLGGEHDLWLANVKGTDGWQQILDRFQKIPIKTTAGKHEIMAGFIDRSHVESDDNVGAGGGGGPGGAVPVATLRRGIDILEIKGPYKPTGISYSASRPLIFVCDPKALGETPCAKKIAENLAHGAYRRPITPEDIAILMRFYDEGRLDKGNFDQGVAEIVAGVLSSPDFLYRSIQTPKTVSRTSEFRLSDLELATRLSFFLWSTGPDAELLKLAETRQLTKPGVLDAQVKRMLADPKAESIVTSFAMKWLNLNSLDLVQPDAKLFPTFNATLRKDFAMEAQRFLDSVLLQNKGVLELLTSDKTFLNNRLAAYYRILPAPATSAFKEVTLTDPNRFGLLGKAAILMRTSYGDRTSPVLRGAFVLDKLIGAPPTPPPPNVDTNLNNKEGEVPKTVRARLEAHRDKPACRQCHAVIDPAGLALENFDAIGGYRTTDRLAANAPIDATTLLPSGDTINGVTELRGYLTKRPEFFATSFTEKLMMYAINRPLEYFDKPQVRKVVRNAKKDDFTLTSLVLGIVNSDAFQKQAPPVAKTVAKPAPKQVAVAAAPASPAAAKPATAASTAAKADTKK